MIDVKTETWTPDLLRLFPAALVVLERGSTVLLQCRRNTGYMDGRWSCGVAGKVEHGESVLDTAVREAREEVGVRIRPETLELLTVVHSTDGTTTPSEQRVNWFFGCRDWDGTARILEPHKCSELAWFRLDDLPERMVPHERVVLERLCAGTLFHTTVLGFAGSGAICERSSDAR